MNVNSLFQPFFLEETYAMRLGGIVSARLNAGIDPIPHFSTSHPKLAEEWMGVDDDGTPVKDFFNEWDLGNIKVKTNKTYPIVSINGVMSRDGNCSYGNELIGQFIQLLDKDPEVKGIVLSINSPGGTADSTQELADIVANTKKPVLAYVKSMAASAAYYVASQADYIVLSSESTASVGSIGVLMQYTNVAKALEKQGVEAEIIRATKSTDKAKLNSLEPLTDELRQEIVTDLDIAMETFEKYVKRGRASRLTSSEVFSGKMYRAKEALKLGLIDEIGNMKTAYTRIKQL